MQVARHVNLQPRNTCPGTLNNLEKQDSQLPDPLQYGIVKKRVQISVEDPWHFGEDPDP